MAGTDVEIETTAPSSLARPHGGPRSMVRVYRRHLGAHLRSTLEYETDFWLLVVGGALTQVVGIVFVLALFEQVPSLAGWSRPEVMTMFAMVTLAEGVGSLLFNGVWWLPWAVNDGSFDYRLTRPYPLYLQVTGANVGLNGIGNLMTGGALMMWGVAGLEVAWTPQRLALAVVLAISAVTIKQSITTISNSLAFWLEAPTMMLASGVHQMGDLTKYPITVYGGVVRTTLTWFIPFAFVSYFPVAALLGRGDAGTIGLFTPVVALLSVLIARTVFRKGLTRYESTGS